MSFTNDWFVIKDFDGFVNKARIVTYNSYGQQNLKEPSEIDDLMNISSDDQRELDKILSYKESVVIVKSLVKKQKSKRTNKIRFIINDDLYIELIQTLGDRMTSNILQGLVSKGLIEMGFDEEQNDFIFWLKEDNN